jgi:chromosome segregation ATPase
MSDTANTAKNLRDRLSGSTEERLGKALGELLESPLLTGAIGKAFDAREKAAQAQEVALGALNLPSAADIERLTRRLRSVSHRLEGIEDGVGRLDRALTPSEVERSEIARRLAAVEAQLAKLTEGLEQAQAPATPRSTPPASKAKPAKPAKPAKAKAAKSRKG